MFKNLQSKPVSYRGLTTVSRKLMIKRLDTVVKPRYDTECVFRSMQQCLPAKAGIQAKKP
ncbi:palindromic element RPE4 domain-containing protein [Rickettsia endosymbiont of Orchestes rusci]|uniref:palindromic element RPE4 domain-containing protein n=1 Tax=Rickettsia endosymbiont of Orchestes rusci TaxID=3066250 RepID=UPI00313EA9CE